MRSMCQSSDHCVLVQEAICTAGQLFLAAHKGLQRQALLPARARDEGLSVGELLFDKLPGAAQDGSADEAAAWQVRCEEIATETCSPVQSRPLLQAAWG